MLPFLKGDGYIGHEMVSFYVDFTGKGHIKFGDFDREAVAESAKLTAVPSSSKSTFDFDLVDVEIAGEDRFGGKASFNPAFPHIYLPKDDWTDFVKRFNTKY